MVSGRDCRRAREFAGLGNDSARRRPHDGIGAVIDVSAATEP
jgi:hypothetical protein